MLSGRSLGDFVVRDKIGEGSFGVVYRAEQPLLGREAVVKVLRAGHGGDADVIARFLGEARLASRLDHPYAAHIYASGAEPDGLLWIAMELVRGTPLGELLRHAPPPLERLVPLIDRICEVVHAAHEQGIVHRDLKPANVMVLSRAGRLLPKLLDFGIARRHGDAEAATPAGAVVGSPHYMAPEQWARAAGVDGRADIYALGVLAYEALTGRRPFEGETLLALAHAHARQPPPPVGPGLPAALDEVLGRALAKKPQDRFATAVELAAALRAAAGMEAEAEGLPQLDERLRELFAAAAPQPLAEAIAALEAARNAHHALAALWNVVHVGARLFGIYALAGRSRLPAPDSPAAIALLRALHQRDLRDEEWLELSGELVRPWHDRRDAHPLPELVAAPGAFADLVALRALSLEGTGHALAEARELLGRALALLAAALRAAEWLCDYPLLVAAPEGAVAERWSGVRRAARRLVEPRGARLLPRQVALCDGDDRPVLSLSPLVQVAPPAPGAPDELFLFAGKGRGGARLVAPPLGLERFDAAPWEWLASQLGGGDEAAGPATDAERPPYRGLVPFSAADADNFFGREREVEALVNRLRLQPLVAVVGPSGAGKSSFVQAGVIPSLPPGWTALTVRPGPSPLAALAAAVGGPVADAEGLRARLAAAPGVRLLVVDQLEELLTLCLDPEERLRYAAIVAGVARSLDDPVRVVVTLRDDFLGRAEQLAPLRNRLALSLQLLTTPAPADLTRILVEPARRAGYELEDRQLASEMVAEVADQPGALALLSFTAAELWALRDRHFKLLGRKAYRAMGGVGGALAGHAERVMAALGPEEQGLVREAFRHLVTADGTRAVLSRGELGEILGPRANVVLAKLVDARLLVTSEGPAGEERVEVVHEALLAAWPRLVGWRREDAEGARLRDQLRAAARQWDERGRVRGLLWRDEAFLEYRVWRGRFPGRLGAVEEAFAAASAADAARGRRLRLGLLAGAFLALGVVVVVLVSLYGRSRAALAELFEEQGRQALLGHDPLRALVLFSEAMKHGARGAGLDFMTSKAAAVLDRQRLLLRHDAGVRWVDFSRDGRLLVTASDDATARVWDAADGRLIHAFRHGDRVARARFDAAGERVLTASRDGAARIFRVADGALLATMRGHAGEVYEARFSPDGQRVLTVGADATVGLWDAVTGASLWRVPADAVEVGDAIFAAGGARVLSGGDDGAIKAWDAAGGTLLSSVLGHRGQVLGLVLAPAGDLVASWANDRTVKVWRADTLAPLVSLAGHGGTIYRVAFDGRGTRLVTASFDGTAKLWEVPSGLLQRSLDVPGALVTEAAFFAGDSRVLTAASDGTLVVWDSGSGKALARLAGHTGGVWSASLLADGAQVASASSDGTARVWDTASADLVAGVRGIADTPQLATLTDHAAVAAGAGGVVRAWAPGSGVELRAVAVGAGPVVLSRDGRRAAVIDGAKARLWDLDAGRALGTVTAERPILYAGLGRDGHLLVTTHEDGLAAVWETAAGARAGSFGVPGAASRFAGWNDAGTLLAVTTDDGVARLWDARTGRLRRELRGHHDAVTGATFDRQGRRVVTTSEDTTAVVWEVESGRLLRTLTGHTAPLTSATFAGSGELVATTSYDQTTRIWDPVGGKQLYAFAINGRAVTSASFSSDDRLLFTTSIDGTGSVWDMSIRRYDEKELARVVQCRVPFRLSEGNVVLEPHPACP